MIIIGAGLAGCEAALQLAKQGIAVDLFEMRPKVNTPAHKTSDLAELVCSNSFKGLAHSSAHGLLKEELKLLDCELLKLAFEARIPAGESLAIDRQKFSSMVMQAIEKQPLIRLHREEVTTWDDKECVLIASGPLTSDKLADTLSQKLGTKRLFFFDSIAPVVEADSIDMESAYAKNRWDKGDTPDFINCPLTQEEYEGFVTALCAADSVEPKPFEKGQLFEGCLPVEEMARRGLDTLRFGPMRPVGLARSENEKFPHAVIQLRAENTAKTLYNLVGFQTRLKWGTQKDIFSKVPALKNASFVRFGAMHRNTFIDSPKLLNLQLRAHGSSTFFAGQITGAEGYTEALATGLYAASCITQHLLGFGLRVWPKFSCIGSLVTHLTSVNPDFQPMNFNFGLLPDPPGKRSKQKKQLQAESCLASLKNFNPFVGNIEGQEKVKGEAGEFVRP